MSTQPIKIVRIIARLNVGGPAIHVSLLTSRLGPPEFESVLVAGRVSEQEGDMGYLAECYGVKPIFLETMSREISLLADLKTLLELIRLIRRERPDVVHTHTAKAGLVGRVAAWLTRTPVIIHTLHGHVLRGYFSPRKEAVFRALERFCARLSDRVLTVSAEVRRELLGMRIAPPSKLQVCELGLDLQRFADTPRHGGVLRKELGLARHVPLFGTCGRLTAIKNQEMFLEAAAKLRSNVPEAHFVLIGGGELQDALKATATRLWIADCVHFLGWRTELAPLFADLDLFVLTSVNEGTPVTIIEAAATGVPVLSTAVGGVPDLVIDGETGWLVPSEDVDALAAAMAKAATDFEAAERLARRQQAAILARFAIDRLVDDLSALYKQLVAEKGRRRRS